MTMEMNYENFKNMLIATKALKRIFNRSLTDAELEELIKVGFLEFCAKRGLTEDKITVINQMREFLNKYAETPNILPPYCFTSATENFIAELANAYKVSTPCKCTVKKSEETLEDDINSLEGFKAETKEEEFKIALKALLDKYQILEKEQTISEIEVPDDPKDDIDIMIDRLIDGDELEVSEQLKNIILSRLYENYANFAVNIVNGKMTLKQC